MVEIAAEDYSWVEPEYLAHKPVFFLGEEMSSGPLELGGSFDWGIILVPTEKRIFHTLEECFIPFYSCIFWELGVRLPLTSFEEILDHLRVQPFTTSSLWLGVRSSILVLV